MWQAKSLVIAGMGIFCVMVAAVPAGAQINPPANPSGPAAQPRPCSNDQRLRTSPEEANAPRDPSRQNLSDQLSRNEGVLCPPDVDPEIEAPTPQSGRTPVIPPPGSPGGNPAVRPK